MVKRQFNAETQYFIAPANTEKSALEGAWLELAEGIITADPDINEETEEFAYYDLGGGKEEVVGAVSQAYNFEGHYDHENKAQKMIAEMEWAEGSGRDVWFKVKDPEGNTFIGLSTVSGIKIRGGDANAYRPFEATIRYKGKPEKGTEEI